MRKEQKRLKQTAEIVPLFGRDEMNLVEFPFGPITASETKTFEVEHPVFDKALNREVNRKLLITGSDAFGPPRPIDDQVLMGMKALTYEAGFNSRRVEFSRYHLCRTLGWAPDGRSYQRLEDAFDRIAGTTLKFKDSWWDKGESEWKSKTFHLIEEVELCSKDRLDRARMKNRKSAQSLCAFVWGEVIWKSFQDGYMKKMDMKMWRRISSQRRKEVPLRLYRILDKRFYRQSHVRFNVRQLCIGTLGVSSHYAPSQMVRVIKRAADWLVECHFLREVRIDTGRNGEPEATFIKANRYSKLKNSRKTKETKTAPNLYLQFFESLPEEKRGLLLEKALDYCKENKPNAVDGYFRNKAGAGETFQRYQELVVSTYLKSKKKAKTQAA